MILRETSDDSRERGFSSEEKETRKNCIGLVVFFLHKCYSKYSIELKTAR